MPLFLSACDGAHSTVESPCAADTPRCTSVGAHCGTGSVHDGRSSSGELVSSSGFLCLIEGLQGGAGLLIELRFQSLGLHQRLACRDRACRAQLKKFRLRIAHVDADTHCLGQLAFEIGHCTATLVARAARSTSVKSQWATTSHRSALPM